jgi:hypothetical protein
MKVPLNIKLFMYKHQINNGIRVTHEIWHMMVPLNIKLFMQYVKKGVILTKENLAKRN